jgi:hypothetical protein
VLKAISLMKLKKQNFKKIKDSPLKQSFETKLKKESFKNVKDSFFEGLFERFFIIERDFLKSKESSLNCLETNCCFF